MILTLKRNLNKFLLVALLMVVLAPTALRAESVELSVSPTLFEMAAAPGQVWKSQIKVINTNSFPLTVYAQVMNFAPQGEAGQGKFLPVFEESTEGTTLAEWLSITNDAITIAPEQSMNVPFTVLVPDNAAPGGHFAAIMIGTRPPEQSGKFQVATAQIVTSLFFVRISGDVIEDGAIREFTVAKTFTQTPEAAFSLRFENKGNVHIQPQGTITITNMWGKERGLIPINSQTNFGNVLPNSVRKFEFTWKGERSILDIGRYKASVTLAYGLDARKFESSATYFYVIPVKALLIVLGSLVMAFWFISWAIKAYVRRMLALAGVAMYSERDLPQRSFRREGDVLIEKRRRHVEAPLVFGWADFKLRLSKVSALTDRLAALLQFTVQYKLFFLSLLGFLVLFIGLYYFVSEVGERSKNYEVTISNADTPVTLSSEDIIYESKHADTTMPVTTTTSFSTTTEVAAQEFQLTIINAGDVPGAAADLKSFLESKQYTVAAISSDFNDTRAKTVVVYDSEFSEVALALSKQLGQALLSANPESNEPVGVTIYIGNDYTFNTR